MEDEVQTTPEVDVTSFTSESSGSTTTTKDAAKIVAHSSKTNEPIDSVERILPAIKTFDIWDDQSQITPLLTDYISSHPIKQKAVERDVPNYSYTERTLGKLGSLYGKTTKSMELSKRALEIADYRNGGIAAKVSPDLYKIKDDFDLAAKQTEYDNLKEQLKEYTKYDTDEDPITDTATGVLGLLAQIGTAPVRQPKVATAAGVGAAAGTASTGVGVLASLPSGALGAIGGSSIVDNVVTTAGSIYQEAYLDNPRKAFINEKDAYEISLAAGVVSGGIEYVQQVFTFGGSKLLDKVPAAKGLTRKAIVQALRTGKGTAVIATAKALGQAVASSMEEYSQQIVQGVATDIAAGKNEFKPIGERVWIAAKENATSDAALQSAAIGAFAPAAVGGTVKGVTALGKTAKGYFVDVNEKLGEAGAIDTGGGDGQPPSDNGEAKPKKEFRFVIQDTEVKKAKQAEATAQFIKDVAETRYTEANPDTVEAVEKSISPEGYGFVHVADMEALTAQDQKLLKKWQSFTGQLAEGTKVVKIANHDIVALQRVNNEVANIYRVTPDATSVKSHAKWLEKLDNNRQKVQDLMTELDVEQKDVSKLYEGDVKYAPDLKTQLNEAVAQSSENILPDTVEVDQTSKESLRVKYDILTEQLDNAMKKQDSQAIQVAVDNLVEHITKEETGTLKKSESIYTQLKDLGLNITKSTMKLVRADAKTVVGETKLNQMDPRIFAQNAREYAREANVSLARGDYDAYYEAKHLQLTNIEAIKETQKVKNELSKLLTTIENVSSYDVQQQLKTLNNNSVEFINDIVSIFNVDPKEGKVRLDNEEYAAFIKDLMARNVPVPTLTNEMFESTGVELKTLTPNQIQAVNTALNSAVVATKKEISLFKKDKEVKLASVVERIHKLVGTRKDADPANYERVQSILQEKDLATYKQLMKDNSPLGFLGRGLNSLLGNLADIVKYDLDLGENNGYFTQLLYNPLLESANEKSQLTNTFNQVVAGFIKVYGVAEWNKLENTKIDFFNTPLSKAELIIMTGYLGTDSSRKRLSRWLGQNINDITAELEKHVTAKDVANVQTIINFYENVMLPKERQQYQRMGWTPKNEVPAVPFKFAGKEFNGGYLPLNTIMDDLSKAQRESTSHSERVRSGQVNVETMTQNQTFDVSELSRDENSALPINLSLTELKSMFDMRAQAYAFGESVYNINRILGDPIAQKALVNVLGPQKYFILHDTIQTLAGNRYSQEIATEKKAKKVLNIITQNATFAAIGGNFTTVSKQGASLPLMVKNLASSGDTLSATKYITAAILDVVSNPIAWFQQAEFIAKFDSEFAAKFKQWNKNNPDFLRLAKSIDPTLDQVEDHRKWMTTRGWEAFRALSLAPLSYVSLALNTIQWTAAYNMAMDGKVKNVPAKTQDAALHATKMVKYSLERSELFEKSDFQRLWFAKPFAFMTNQLSVIGSYFTNQFNLAGRKSKIDPKTTVYQYSKASANAFFAVAIPAMILKLLFGKATEDDETGEMTAEYEKLINNPKTWIAKNTMWSYLDSIPVVSSVSYMAQGNLEYGNPVSDVMTGAAASWKVLSGFVADEDLSEYKYKDARYKARKFLTGTLLGLPFRKVQDAMFDYMFSGPAEGQGVKLYKDLPDGISSTDKNEAGLYDVAKESLNVLWQGKNELVEPSTDTAASIIKELEDNAQTREEAQLALNAKRLTSPRGYLINPEYREVTIRTEDSQRVIQLTKEEDKDLEIYLDTIGRKETRNYQSLINPNSSARGYVQIVDSTRASLQKLYPEYKIYENTPTLELPKDVQFDMARKLNMEVYRKIKDLSIQSDDTRYSMWYITGHVLGNSPEGRAVIKAYKDGDLNTKIKDLIPENIISGNPSVFGRLSDDLTLAEVIDRVENGYDNVQGIVDYKKLSEKDYDDGVGAIK